MEICYLYGAGKHYLCDALKPDKGDYVIAVDGGYDFLMERHITPDLAMGDFDSASGKVAEDIPVISFSPEKDYTDMYLAAMEGVKAGYEDFAIYGGCGGRVDHTMANISLLAKLASMNRRAYLFADGYVITAVKDSPLSISKNGSFCAMPLKAKKNGYVSVFSHSDISMGVAISGLKYEAADVNLANTSVLGTSNEFCGRNSLISVKSGTLIIMIETA